MNEEKDFILIEEYLDGQLDGEALVAFEKRLKEDTTLSAEVDLYREINERIEASAEKEALQKEWREIIKISEAEEAQEDQTNDHGPAKIRNLRFYLVRIAAIAVIILSAWFVWPDSLSNEQLATNYWEQTVDLKYTSVDRSTDKEGEYLEQLKDAYAAYEAKDYTKALSLANSISPRTEEVILFTGATYFGRGDYANASRNFNQIVQKTGSVSRDEAMWYLALAYLKNGDDTQAVTILETIITQKSWKHDEAKTLLNKISK